MDAKPTESSLPMRNLSLFTGSGIGDLAAKAAGIETVAMCESDPACCYCLERMWPGVRLFRDVHDVTAASLADLGPIDIISGGFPCQDISTAGKGAGLGTEENKTRSGLWYEFARVIREVRPAWLLIENVPALRVRGGDRVCEDLESMGYAWEAVVVGADDVGAPHRRKRVWIVGRLANAGRDACPAPQRNGDESEREDVCKARPDTDGTSTNRLADPLCNLCGRGGNESERGPEGRTAVGRAGAELGNPASDGQRRAGSIQGERPVETGGPGGYGDGELADGKCTRLEGASRAKQQPIQLAFGSPARWPSRPGEPQHEWEAPRLVEFGLGDAVDGISRRVRSRANKTLLRMAGNAWCYPVAELMFRGIVELDKEGSTWTPSRKPKRACR